MKLWNWLKAIFKKDTVVTKPVESAPSVPKETLPEASIKEEVENFPFTINEGSKKELELMCKIIINNKARYLSVQDVTGVPWDVVAACHYRESSLSFKGVLHNGEYIIGTGKKTKLVPAGRGPFNSWEEAAFDAMKIESSKFPKVWDLAGKLDFCEKYNGLGYRKKGIPSPYVYAGTNKYTSGLYVADGKFSASKVDMRLGCAAIIKGLSS